MNSHSKKEKIYKCRYKHCPWNNQVSSNQAIKVGNNYYHKNCGKDFTNLKKIRELSFQVDNTVVFSCLNKYLKELVIIRKIETDYILFTLEYIIENELEVHMPYGLLYRLNDYKIKQAYNAPIPQSIIIHSS
jgi:hypothetical protein